MKVYGDPSVIGQTMAVKRMKEALRKQVDISERFMTDKELYEGKQSIDYAAAREYHVETESLVRMFDAILKERQEAIYRNQRASG